MNGLAAINISALQPQQSELFHIRTLLRELDHLLRKGRQRPLTHWEMKRLSEIPAELVQTASTVTHLNLEKCCDEILEFSEQCVLSHLPVLDVKPLRLN